MAIGVYIKTYTELLKEDYHTVDDDILVSDDLFFTEPMATLGGREVTIKDIKENEIVELTDWDIPINSNYTFHVNMLKQVKNNNELANLESIKQVVEALQLNWKFVKEGVYTILYDEYKLVIATFDTNSKII